MTDVHSNYQAFDRILEDASRVRPDLVVEAGDFVHEGTWSGFRRAYASRARLEPPWRVAKGNHDALRRGPFPVPPPPLPTFQSFSCMGVRFVLLDNHDEHLSEEQFDRLESELEAHQDARIVVAMHVPASLSREPFMTRLRHAVPFRLASPTMADPQASRFMALMARYRVLAVLAGHAHFHDEQLVDGVRYIVAGAAGGLVPGLAIPQEYLDIEIDGRAMQVRRVEIQPPAGDPVTFVARAFRFFARTNGFKHDEQGWNYVPSVSVQTAAGVRLTEARDARNAAATGAISFERLFGPSGRRGALVEVGLSAAPRELAGALAVQYRLRPVGDFNRNGFLAAGPVTSVGLLQGRAAAGIGARLELGAEWDTITIALRHDRATNHRATGFVLGRRF